jgi:hypothetical protein
LELVDIEVKRPTILDIGDVATAHRGELNLGHEERTEDAGVVFADETFGQIHDEDFAFVHDLADIERTLWLTDDVTDDGVCGEGADFVEDRRDRFGLEFVSPAGKFDVPELQHDGVGAVAESFFAEFFVGEHAGDVEHCCLWAIKQCEDGIAQDVLEARSPTVAEHAFEHADDLGADVCFLGWVCHFEWVKSERIRGVSRVEIDDVFDARFWDEFEVIHR